MNLTKEIQVIPARGKIKNEILLSVEAISKIIFLNFVILNKVENLFCTMIQILRYTQNDRKYIFGMACRESLLVKMLPRILGVSMTK